jgi:hypothetical protein
MIGASRDLVGASLATAVAPMLTRAAALAVAHARRLVRALPPFDVMVRVVAFG